jgi:hypothetical protein
MLTLGLRQENSRSEVLISRVSRFLGFSATLNRGILHFMKSVIQTQHDTIRIYDASEADSIERCPHDAENPYVIISRNILRDNEISPNCRWLICYLLSNDKGWHINRRQVAAHVKKFIGRDKTDSLFEEAIEAGYMKRVDILIKREKGGALRRCKYYLSETKKFKKCFRHTEFQGPGVQGAGNQCDKETTSEGVTSKVLLSCVETPPVAPSHVEKIKKKDFKGKDIILSKEEVYAECVLQKKDWTKEEIEEAWLILEKYEGPVRDWFKFYDGTIQNLRKTARIKELKEQKPCKSRFPKKTSQPHQESKQSSNTNDTTSKKDTLGRHFLNWKPTIPPLKNSKDT